MRRLPIIRNIEDPSTWPLLLCLSDECREKLLAAYPELVMPVLIDESSEELERIMKQPPRRPRKVA